MLGRRLPEKTPPQKISPPDAQIANIIASGTLPSQRTGNSPHTPNSISGHHFPPPIYFQARGQSHLQQAQASHGSQPLWMMFIGTRVRSCPMSSTSRYPKGTWEIRFLGEGKNAYGPGQGPFISKVGHFRQPRLPSVCWGEQLGRSKLWRPLASLDMVVLGVEVGKLTDGIPPAPQCIPQKLCCLTENRLRKNQVLHLHDSDKHLLVLGSASQRCPTQVYSGDKHITRRSGGQGG